MKVLTIQEPYATFIMKGFKRIETRSFKTNYRGEIYIHAGLSNNFLNKISDDYILSLFDKSMLNHGKIICKARLTDCIYMTNEYIEDLKSKNNREFMLGDYKVGRYAWILEDVEELDEKISVKGKLGIWNMEDKL